MSGGAGYTSEPAQMMHGFSYLWWGTPDPVQQMGAYTAESAPIAHETWLTDGGVAFTPANSVFVKGLAAIAANPYDGVSAYSPTDDLTAIAARYDEAMLEVGKLVGRGLVINEKGGVVDDVQSNELQDVDVLTQEDGYWVGGILEMISGPNQGLKRLIVKSTQSTKSIEFEPEFPQINVVGNTYKVTLREGVNWGAIVKDGAIDVDSYIDDLVSKALASITSSVVDDEVDEFESDANEDYLRSLSRFAGGMVDVNAVCGSAFIMGMSLMENDRARAVRKYRAGLRRELYQLIIETHTRFTAQAVRDMLESMRVRATLELDSTRISVELMKIGAVVKSDKILQDADIDRSEKLWPLQVHEEMSSILNSVTGASVLPERQPAWKSSLSGAVGGAAAGALVGSSVPGIGTGIGAGIGAALGALTAQSS